MFNVTPARINSTIIVIIKAIKVIAKLEVRNLMFDVGMFDVILFKYSCPSFGSSGTPTPTVELYPKK